MNTLLDSAKIKQIKRTSPKLPLYASWASKEGSEGETSYSFFQINVLNAMECSHLPKPI